VLCGSGKLCCLGIFALTSPQMLQAGGGDKEAVPVAAVVRWSEAGIAVAVRWLWWWLTACPYTSGRDIDDERASSLPVRYYYSEI